MNLQQMLAWFGGHAPFIVPASPTRTNYWGRRTRSPLRPGAIEAAAARRARRCERRIHDAISGMYWAAE